MNAMTFAANIRTACVLADPPEAREGQRKDLELTAEQLLRLVEVRNELLLELGRLLSPSLRLRKLAEFKEDLAIDGVEEVLAKWAVHPEPAPNPT